MLIVFFIGCSSHKTSFFWIFDLGLSFLIETATCALSLIFISLQWHRWRTRCRDNDICDFKCVSSVGRSFADHDHHLDQNVLLLIVLLKSVSSTQRQYHESIADTDDTNTCIEILTSRVVTTVCGWSDCHAVWSVD